MDAKKLLECAPRLSQSNFAYVILDSGDRGAIVPPGASQENHRTILLAGKQSYVGSFPGPVALGRCRVEYPDRELVLFVYKNNHLKGHTFAVRPASLTAALARLPNS